MIRIPPALVAGLPSLCLLVIAPARAGQWEVGADLAAELRTFVESPRFSEQLEHFQPSTVLNMELRWDSQDSRHQLVFAPFARLDGADSRRTHVDLREGYYRYAGDRIDVQIGAAKVFWGVTESRHLVDIVNQTDAIEDIDEEDKFGQPMVKLSFLRDWGQVDLFALPVFRERTFPGRDGRLRFDPVIAVDDAQFGNDGDDQADHTDFALRYSHYFGNVDLGLSFFNGTSREPNFAFGVDGGTGQPVITPVYQDIRQFGIDAQYTADAWLWKFEGIVREGQGDTVAATVAGFEYTLYGVGGGNADLGLLMEHQYDGRDFPAAPVTVQDNDLFYGARLALNDAQDTSLLAGAITDLEDGSTSASIEAERRFGQVWTGELEARLFLAVDQRNLLDAFARDSFVTLRLTRYF